MNSKNTFGIIAIVALLIGSTSALAADTRVEGSTSASLQLDSSETRANQETSARVNVDSSREADSDQSRSDSTAAGDESREPTPRATNEVDNDSDGTASRDGSDTDTRRESGEKGGTEDINIGIGELQESEAAENEHKDWIIIESVAQGSARINKDGLIDEFTNSTNGGLRSSGYLKIGDIKGESSDRASGSGDDGDGDLVEASSSSKKTREIVVVGSKVRASSVPQILEVGAQTTTRTPDSFFDIWIDAGEDRNAAPDSFFDIFVDTGEDRANVDSFFDIFVDVSDQDLQLHAVSIAQAHQDIETVEVRDSEVEVEVREQLNLFGFIPLQASKRIMVDATVRGNDRVQVKYPWWSFLATKAQNAAQVQSKINTHLDLTVPEVGDVDDRPTEEVAFYYNKLIAQALLTISTSVEAQEE